MPFRNLFDRFFGPSQIQKRIAIQVNDVGTVLAQKGLLEEAISNFTSAVKLYPTVPEFWSNLGNALHFSGESESACQCFEKGSKLNGAPAHLYDNWGGALADLGRFTEAIEAHKKALAIDPTVPDALSNLGNAYRAMGRIEDALMNLDAAVALAPDSRTIASARLYTLNFLTQLSNEDIAYAHTCWPGARTEAAMSFSNDPDPERILRVGYVSSDFRLHSCANFILPLLEQHDRSGFHVTAFSGVEKPDDVTKRIASSVDAWVNVPALSEQEFFDEVQSRSIDLLIDCSGHTSKTRLAAFLLKPAPVQISWLGYPNTTGLSAMDARLTDAVATPADMANLFSEALVPLPDGFHSYRPVKGDSPTTPLPMVKNGYPTFGAFHNLAKISDRTLALFAEVLSVVPDARLLVKSKSFSDTAARTSFESKCTKFGLDLQRIETRPWRPGVGEHFVDFSDIDIALDATPYNGTTTTCEALWMGVPVITLCGDRPAGRVSASLLTQIKHSEWIAEDDDGYVRIAQELAADQSRLVKIRNTLRDDLLQSSLGDANKFARSVEDAYRSLWRGWCKKQASASR